LQGYFGRISGLPPGLPGGGITGVLPASGVGAWISGSTPGGGQSTPSDLASLSASCSLACPVVPSGATIPRGGRGAAGAQLAASSVAVGCGGVVAEGGAWAAAPCTDIVNTPKRRSADFLIWRKQMSRVAVPRLLGLAVTDQGEMAHRRHRPAFSEADAAVPMGPFFKPRPWELGPPA
jgi:hypothetical protein